jgi:hypothetical protein
MWNHHKLRTESYKSLSKLYTTWMQLHTEGMIDICHSHNRFQDYSLDWEGHDLGSMYYEITETYSSNAVVDLPQRPLTENQWRLLVEEYRQMLQVVFEEGNDDWMLSNHNYGIDYYRETKL